MNQTPTTLDPNANAFFIQVYANNNLVTTSCFINVNQTPNLVSDVTPVDDSAYIGPQQDSYVVYQGQVIRNYVIQGNDSIKVG